MTFAGKILVIVIMAMSLVFLGISTVSLTTARDWKAEIARQSKANQELQTQLTTAQADLQNFQGRLAAAQKEHAGATKAIDGGIAALKADDQKDRNAIDEAQKTLQKHQGDAKTALEDTKGKNEDIIKLRQEVEAVNEQARKFRVRQEELDAEIVNIRRMLDAAKTNSSQIHQSH